MNCFNNNSIIQNSIDHILLFLRSMIHIHKFAGKFQLFIGNIDTNKPSLYRWMVLWDCGTIVCWDCGTVIHWDGISKELVP